MNINKNCLTLSDLPSEIICHIFNNLDRHSLKKMEQVSKFFNVLIKQNSKSFYKETLENKMFLAKKIVALQSGGINTFFSQIRKAVKPILIQLNVNKVKQNELFENYSKALAEFTASKWSEEFKTEELQEIIKFNMSPVGKKTLSLMPKLTAEAQQFGEQYVKNEFKKLGIPI